MPRAYLRIGPASLARHQLSLALGMDCQRIVCLAAEMSPDILQLQQDSERAGAKLHVVNGAHGLARLVTANDDLLLIADGLLMPIGGTASLLDGQHTVLVQPVEAGTAAGFERIDLNHASAGLMRIPGRLAERLQELPDDCDVESALTRLALQAGVAQRPLPAEARDGMRWRLVRNEGEADAAEAVWIALHLDDDGPLTPASALARLAVRNFGPAMLHAGNGGNTLVMAAAAILGIALGFGWFGLTVSALLLMAIAWIVRRTAALLLAVERESLALAAGKWSREPVFGWLHDAAILAVLVWNAPPYAGSSPWEAGYAPLIVLSLLRLAPVLYARTAAAWLADRALLGIVLAGFAAGAVLVPGIQLLGAGLALVAIFRPSGPVRLTTV